MISDRLVELTLYILKPFSSQTCSELTSLLAAS